MRSVILEGSKPEKHRPGNVPLDHWRLKVYGRNYEVLSVKENCDYCLYLNCTAMMPSSTLCPLILVCFVYLTLFSHKDYISVIGFECKFVFSNRVLHVGFKDLVQNHLNLDCVCACVNITLLLFAIAYSFGNQVNNKISVK